MLAGTLPPGGLPEFPVEATPKLDGIRALKIAGQMVSRQFKPIPNADMRKILEDLLPDGADGEIMYGTTFQACTSAVMTKKPIENMGKFKYYWFDYISCEGAVDAPYVERANEIREYMREHAADFKRVESKVDVVPLYPLTVHTSDQLQQYEREAVAAGFEGVIVRRGDGKYKFGRSTLREGLMLKIKRFGDAEATIIDFEELQHNDNEAIKDAFGRSKRSSHKANKTAADKLGAFVVISKDNVQFKIGTGLSDEQRIQFWKDRKTLLGKMVKYKFFEVGVKSAPRHPVFLGFRHEDDS